MAEQIIIKPLQEVMAQSTLDYAMSVITDRALSDSRDGLKPVMRRILYDMYTTGNLSTSTHRKSAKSVGSTMGRFHAHGDMSIYEAMVKASQDFNIRYPLIDMSGNNGNIDGDPAAAMRYTESRLSRFGEAMLESIKKNTVEMQPNFDDTEPEPKVLPTLIPNLLANGIEGIAVGMATKMAPHNLTEIYEALDYIIESVINGEEPDENQIISIIKGPDFPLGGKILGTSGIIDAFKTGKGKIVMQSTYEIVESSKGDKIIVTELPYKVNKSDLIDKINDLSKTTLNEVKEVSDLSDKKGITIEIALKKDASSQLALNKLLKQTDLQCNFNVNNTVLVEGKPQLITLFEMLQLFLTHSAQVVSNEASYDRDKANLRLKIVNAILWAISDEFIDQVIDSIRTSKTQEEIYERINGLANGAFDQDQLKAIADMRLRQLSSDNREKYEQEHNALEEEIQRCTEIIEQPLVLYRTIQTKYKALKEKFGDKRRTEIVFDHTEITHEDLIEDEILIMTYTSENMIKTVSVDEYTATNRGAKGVKATAVKNDEYITTMLTVNSKDDIFFFTNKGKCLSLKAYMIQKSNKSTRGKAIANYLSLDPEESIVAILASKASETDNYFMLSTACGAIKKLSFNDIPKVKKGAKVITLNENDSLISVIVARNEDQMMMTTSSGMSIRFSVDQIRAQGRTASGVRGIKLTDHDKVVDAVKVIPEETLLTITTNGLGKRSDIEDYALQNRGGKGVITHKLNNKTGNLVSAIIVNENDEILIATKNGQMIRTNMKNIRVLSRNSSGVILASLRDDDQIVSISKIIGEGEEDGE